MKRDIMTKRNFNPRLKIPKQRLLDDLEAGLTLEEMGEKYHKARSYISELLKMYEIDLTTIEGRADNMKSRRKANSHRSFIDVMYNKIKEEVKK